MISKVRRLTLNKSFRYKYLTLIIAFLMLCLLSKSEPDARVSGEVTEVKLAVLMYHGFTDKANESEYVLGISDFEKDIVYLKEKGFTFIFASDVDSFIRYGTPLPEKPVMLTFDDGYLNNYTLAFPVLKKHGIKAVISPIMYFSEVDSQNPERSPEYSNLSFSEISEMHRSGLVEFQNHSYNLHSINSKRHGSGKSDSESAGEYRKVFLEDTLKAHRLLKDITGISPKVYAYPFGYVSLESKSLLISMDYRLALGCTEGYNYLKYGDKGLHIIKRFNRTPEKNAEVLLSNY